MYKQDAINFFGTRGRVAKAAGVLPSAVSQWGLLVPEARAVRLQSASNGALNYDASIYDAHRNAKRNGDPNRENQT